MSSDQSSVPGSGAALLTDDAVQALARYARRPRCSDWGEGLGVPRIEALFSEMLRHHATDGREALVEAVALAMHDDSPVPVAALDEAWMNTCRRRAEAVVTALVGSGTP